jgi:HlyD family secretion protein
MGSLASVVLERSDRSARRRRFAWLGVLALCAAVGATVGVQRVLGPKVQAERVVRRDFDERLIAAGRVRSVSRAELGVLLAGVAAEVPHREGEHVKRGDVLLRLADAQLRAQLADARAQLLEARARLQQLSRTKAKVASLSLRRTDADLTRAQQALERARSLVASGSLPQADLDEAVRAFEAARAARDAAQTEVLSTSPGGTDLMVARAQLERAEAAVALSQARLEDARIVAPADGVIVSSDVDVGDVVQAGKSLIVLVADGPTEIVFFPDERNLRQLHLGQKARVSADAFREGNLDAVVSYIAPAVDPERGTVEVRLSVPSPPSYLRPEMTVSVDLALGTTRGSLSVPVDAVRNAAGERPSVLQVREGRLETQLVSLGLRSAALVEITEGLSENDVVVADARAGLREGQRVRAVLP